jgi:arsenate reductase (glutaredoxin)
MKIYHNPRCSKSRKGLQYLEEKGCNVEVIKYLEEGLDRDDLREIIAKTGKKPFDFVRTNEKVYKEKFKGQSLSDEQWLDVLVNHPRLLHRPIVVQGDQAVLGNPPENIDALL